MGSRKLGYRKVTAKVDLAVTFFACLRLAGESRIIYNGERTLAKFFMNLVGVLLFCDKRCCSGLVFYEVKSFTTMK